MADRKITYGIGFNVDKSGLKLAQQELEKISNMSFKDAKLINASLTQAEFDKIKNSAKELEQVLKNSFNEKLGAYNLKDLEKNIKNLKVPLDQTYNNMKKLGAEGVSAFRSMAAEVLTTNGNIKETSKLLESMGKTLGNTIKWSIASSVVNTFTGSIQKAWGYTQKLDESLNNIRIVTEKSNEEMEKFAKTANKAAKSLGSSTTSYTNAALIYYQQGLGEQDVQARTTTTIKAANVTGQSAAEVSEQLTAVWNGYKVVAQEAELYVDKLAAVAASTAADLEELSTGMSKVASAANAMGVDVDQLSAQLATIVSVTRQDASVVGTALKTIYSRMGDLKVSGVDEFGTSLGDVSGQLRQMGIEVLDQEGNLRDMGTVIEEVAAKWGTWTNAQQQAAAVAIAGKRQYNNLIALFENWDMYESSLTTSKTSEGTLQKQQEIYLDSLEAKLQKLSTAGEKVWDNLIDTEATKNLIDVLGTITGFIGDLVGGMGGLGGILFSVGGTLIKIFNGQIVTSISRTVDNIRISIRGLNEEAEKESLKNAFGSINEKGLQQMLKIKKDQLTYSKLLTEEEKKQYDNMIAQTAQAHNKLDLAKKRKAELEEFYTKATGKTGDLYLLNHAEAMGNNLEIRATGLETLAKEVSKSASTRTVLDNSYSDFRGKSVSQLKKDQKKTSDSQQISDIQEMIELKALEGKVFQEVGKTNQNALNKLKEANRQYVAGTISSNEYTAVLSNTLREVAKETEDFAQETRKGTENIKEAQTEIDRFDKKYQEKQDVLKQRKIIENITSMIGVVTSAIGVFQSLSNAIQVWQNENLSFGEKASQSIGMIASVAMAVVPVVIKSAAAIKKGVDVSLNWISIILTVAAAALGLVTSIIKVVSGKESALDKANKALEKAKENAKAAKEEYNKLNSSLSELNNTINNLEFKKLELSSLIPGTVAYSQAVAELNQQILELVEKYPQLAEGLNFENGRFILEDDVLKKFQKDLETMSFRALGNIFVSQVRQEEALTDVIEENIKRQAGDNLTMFNPIKSANLEQTLSGLSGINDKFYSDGERILRAFFGLYTGDAFKGQGTLAERFEKLSLEELNEIVNNEKFDELDKSLQDLVKEQIKNYDNIKENNDRIEELNQTYQKMIANSSGIKTSTGEAVFSTAQGKAGISSKDNIITQDQVNASVASYGLDYIAYQDDSENYKNRVGEEDDRSNVEKRIEKDGELEKTIQGLRKMAEDSGLNVTEYPSWTKMGSDKMDVQTFLQDETMMTVNGQKMSINQFVQLATQAIYDKQNMDALNETISNATDRIAGAEQSDAGALGFALAHGLTKDSDGNLLTEGVTLSQAQAAADGGSYDVFDLETGKKIGTDYYGAQAGASYYEEYLKEIVSASGISKNDLINYWLNLPSVSDFTIEDWKNLKKARNTGNKDRIDAIAQSGSSITLRQAVALALNDKTTRTKYAEFLGVGENFGQYKNEKGEWVNKKGYSGLDLREFAINNNKLELDYLEQLNQEMETSFGTRKQILLQETARQQSEVAKNARNSFINYVGGTVYADRNQFIDLETGALNRNKLLDYLAEARADNNTALVTELENILNSFDKMQEKALETVDLQIEAYNYQFEILDTMKEIADSWNELNTSIKNLGAEFKSLNNIESVFTSIGLAEGRLEEEITRLNDFTNGENLTKIYSWSNYTNNATHFEDFSESFSKAGELVNNLISSVDELTSLWSEGLKDIQNQYDKTIQKMQNVSSLLQGQIDLSKMFGGGFGSEELKNNYDSLLTYSSQEYLFNEAKVNKFLEAYKEAVASGQKDLIDSAAEDLMTATKSLMDYAGNRLELIMNKFKDLTSKTLDDALSTLSGGTFSSLASMSLDWGLATDKDNRYLDEVNERYALDELNRAFQKSMDITDSMFAQNKLAEKRVEIEEELANIKEQQGKLTQYDIDRANALYDITLKQIALEEAQQASNKMKLTRDALGNYTYQYVADQDAIAEAEQELAAANNNLYNLDKDRKTEMINEFFSLWEEYQTKMAEAMATGDEELQKRVYEHYLGANGTLNLLKTQLGIVTEGSETLLDGFVNTIKNLDLEELGFNSIFTEASNSISSLEGVIESSLGAEAPLTKVLGALSSGLSPDGLEAALQAANDNASKIIGDETTGLTALAKALPELVNKVKGYQEALGNAFGVLTNENKNGALDANTAAIDSLTGYTRQLVEKLSEPQTEPKNYSSGSGGGSGRAAVTFAQDGGTGGKHFL